VQRGLQQDRRNSETNPLAVPSSIPTTPKSDRLLRDSLEAPRSLLPEVHRLYFEPEHPEFSERTLWSLSNWFTSAFKKLDPVPQFKATAKLGEFLEAQFSQAF